MCVCVRMVGEVYERAVVVVVRVCVRMGEGEGRALPLVRSHGVHRSICDCGCWLFVMTRHSICNSSSSSTRKRRPWTSRAGPACLQPLYHECV